MVESTINWKEQAQKYQEAFLEDLKDLLRIDSVRKDDEATDEFPVWLLTSYCVEEGVGAW